MLGNAMDGVEMVGELIPTLAPAPPEIGTLAPAPPAPADAEATTQTVTMTLRIGSRVV